MKPYYPKRRCKCRAWCGKPIEKGEPTVLLYFRSKKGYYLKAYFHWSCLQAKTDKWFTKHAPSTEKRRKKSVNPNTVHRLKALRSYHKKMGNVQRVAEIDATLETLAVKKKLVVETGASFPSPIFPLKDETPKPKKTARERFPNLYKDRTIEGEGKFVER